MHEVRSVLANAANAAGRLSRRAGAPVLDADSPRETLIAWLQWNDRSLRHEGQAPRPFLGTVLLLVFRLAALAFRLHVIETDASRLESVEVVQLVFRGGLSHTRPAARFASRASRSTFSAAIFACMAASVTRGSSSHAG